MKVSLVNVLMLGAGVILLYSGVKGYDPRDVISYGLGGKKPKKLGETKELIPIVPPESVDPGQSHPGDKNYPDGTQNGGEPTTPASYPGTLSV